MKFSKIGMSDEELEKLSQANERRFFSFPFWICWESENSSFGKCFREWAFYPRFLPLFMCSNHTAYNGPKVWPHEVDERAELYFGWPKKKVLNRLNLNKKKSSTVAHPWIFYRKKFFNKISKKRSGILYFYQHSNDHYEAKYKSIDNLMNSLKNLENKFDRLAICLSFHDIKKGLHKKLRKYSIPLVTAGNTGSHLFVNRFYNLLYNFNYTCSSALGSHVYLSIEAGIPYFNIKNKDLLIVGTGIAKRKSKVKNINDYGDKKDVLEIKKFELSFNKQRKKILKSQKKFVLDKLGYFDSIDRYKASYLIWKEFFLNFDKALFLYFKIFKKIFKKIFIKIF